MSDTQIGAWGISYGGGQTWNGARGGHPVHGSRGRRDVDRSSTRRSGRRTSRSRGSCRLREGGRGALAADRGDRGRRDPLDRTSAAIKALVAPRVRAPRSSAAITTPVYLFQGRVDYAFDVDAGDARLHARSAGPKHLYVGQFGHAPSTFPGPDFAYVLAQGVAWFDHLPPRRAERHRQGRSR